MHIHVHIYIQICVCVRLCKPDLTGILKGRSNPPRDIKGPYAGSKVFGFRPKVLGFREGNIQTLNLRP